MTSIDDLAETIRNRYPTSTVSLKHFESGCASLDVILNESLFVLEYRPGEGYGLSPEVEDDDGFLNGHPGIFQDVPSVAAPLLERLDLCSRAGTTTSGDGSVGGSPARCRVS